MQETPLANNFSQEYCSTVKYLTCQTPEFDKQLAELMDDRLTEQVKELRQKIESLDVFSASQWLDAIRPYRKHRYRNYRVIMKEVRVGLQKVLVFISVFHRADDDYERFLQTKRLPENDNLQALAATRVREAQEPLSGPVPVPPDLAGWLGSLSEIQVGAVRTEFFVHETRQWVQQVNKVFLEEGRGTQLLYQVVLGLVFELDDSTALSNNAIRVVHVREQSNCFVLWGLKDARTICLLNASVAAPTQQELEAAAEALTSPNYEAGIKKAYLSVSVLDEELWRDIQRSVDGNLFLSPDEIALLERLSESGSRREELHGEPVERRSHGLPALISGRAGTGKSTMLAYVFAALVLRQARMGDSLSGKPVYVTYNPRLLEKARHTVRGLLRSNAEFRTSTNEATRKRLEEVLRNLENDYVFSYHDLLRSYLPNDKQDDFGDGSHVDFSDFKGAYLGERTLLPAFPNHAFRQQVSPERAWYVIRQFIKGASVDSETVNETVEEIVDQHGELNESDRLGVSEEEVRSIYLQVYSAWYKEALVDRGLWDDQDLVKTALQGLFLIKDDERPKIAAMVCDEAQDFTPREIRFLVRCVELLRFDLQNIEPLSLPIVLAGDSLQTLAPTGFRWSAVRAILYEEIWSACSKDCYPESLVLQQNYRSRDAIVKFCNLIQSTRKELFPTREDSREIEPQLAWDTSPSSVPSYYRVGVNLSVESFRNVARRMMVLLPCEEAGELDYIRRDPTLVTLLTDRDSDESLETVMSSAAAKGQEFSEVVLYNFGKQFADSGFNMNPQNDDDNSEFAREFFFNKLYVAASRACQSLFIIENHHEVDDAQRTTRLAEVPNLWRQMVVNEDEVQESLARQDEFLGHVVGARFGTETDLNEADSAISPENARKFLEHGISERNREALKRASKMFSRLGPEYSMEEKTARAWCCRVSSDASGAIELFRAADQLAEAWDTALEASLWDEAAAIQIGFKEAPLYEAKLVKMMRSQRDDVVALVELLESVSAAAKRGRFRVNKLWHAAQSEIKERVQLLLGANVVPVYAGDSGVPISQLRSCLQDVAFGAQGLSHLRAEIGDCFVLEKEWKEAITIYGRATNLSEIQESRKLYATAHTQGFPRGLAALVQARMMDEVIRLWEESGSPFEKAWFASVAAALNLKADHLRRFEFALEVGELDEAYSSLAALDEATARLLQSRFADVAATRFDKYRLLLTLVRQVKPSDPSAANQIIEKVVFEAISRWERPQDYSLKFQAFQLDSHENSVPTTARDCMVHFLDLYDMELGPKVIEPRWFGRALEFANEWEKAFEHYDECQKAAGASRDVKLFCRAGYLRAVNRWAKADGQMSVRIRSFGGSDDDRERAREARKKFEARKKWKLTSVNRDGAAIYDNEKCGDRYFPLKAVPHLRDLGAEEFQETGRFADFAWDTEDRIIFLTHRPARRLGGAQRTGATTWTIDPTSTEHPTNRGSVIKGDEVLEKAADGLVRFDVADWRVEVRFSRDETTVRFENIANDPESMNDRDEDDDGYRFKVRN